MSIKYEIIKGIIKASNMKERAFGNTTENFIEKNRKQNSKMTIPELKDADFDITQIQVMGFTVLKMIHKKKSDRANMFIIGGGMVMAPRPASIKKALKFAKETGLDLYIPYYPLCTDYPITKAYEMIYETYKVMLTDYDSKKISLLGTSSGGNLALGLVAYINDGHKDVPMPGHIIAISPGTCVNSEDEWHRMLELEKKDIIIPASYMKWVVDILQHGDDSVPDYMIRLQRGNFTNCPHVSFMYGSDETLYACAPSFEKAMKKYDVNYNMIVGKGMFHCYPVFPVVKEAKIGWNQMVQLAKEA